MKHKFLICLPLLFVSIYANSQFQNWLWAKQVGPAALYGVSGQAIANDKTGYIYTAGFFDGTVDFNPGPGVFNLTSIGDQDIFVSKLNTLGQFVWAISIGGLNKLWVSSITVDDSANVILTGRFLGTVDFDPGTGTDIHSSAGNNDIFIIKLNNSGNLLWAMTIGGTNDDGASCITTDSAGNIFVTGYFSDSADFDPGPGIYNLTSFGQSNAFISRFDPSGNFIWAKKFGGPNKTYGNAITIDAAGNIYSTGYFFGTADFKPGPGAFNLVSHGNSDIYISKLDNSGNFIWAKGIGDNYEDMGKAICVDKTGSVYTTGYFYGNTDFDPDTGTFIMSSIVEDAFICKLDSAGNFNWAYGIHGYGTDMGNTIVFEPSYGGSIYFAGECKGIVDFDPGPAIYNLPIIGYLDIFVSKFDTSGNFLMAKREGGIDFDIIFSMCSDTSGNCYFTGVSYSPTMHFGSIYLPPVGGGHLFITKLSSCISFSSLIVHSCYSYTSPSSLYTWTVSGTYQDTISNVSGCDSIITIHLSIDSVNTTSMVTLTTCDSMVSPSSQFIWTTSGTYQDTIPNAGGCDSIINVNLTVNYHTGSTVADTVCNKLISPSGNYTWTSSGTYHDTVPNATGCDSVIVVNLVVNSTSSTLNVTSCFKYISPSGNYTYIFTGHYSDTLTNSIGCDSIISIHLIIINVNTLVTVNGNTLSANLGFAQYQWLDCNNGFAPLSGDTNRIFNPPINGTYAVAVTFNGCTDTSACFTVSGVGISDLSTGNSFDLHPNPTSDQLIVSFNGNNQKVQVIIFDITGKIIQIINQDTHAKNKVKVNTSDLADGMYFVQLRTEDLIDTKKLIIAK